MWGWAPAFMGICIFAAHQQKVHCHPTPDHAQVMQAPLPSNRALLVFELLRLACTWTQTSCFDFLEVP